MKKALMTLMTVGALAVPFGVLAAEADQVGPGEPVETTVEPERDRDRERRHVEHPTVLGEQYRERAGSGREDCPRTHLREEARVEAGNGNGRQMHEREHVRTEDAAVDGIPRTPAGDGADLQFESGECSR